MTKKTSIDDYLSEVPEDAPAVLEKVRATIKTVAPAAVETISYQVPTFKYHGSLVGFAAFKEHLSFFLMSTSAMEAHIEELEAYDTSKGTIRFPVDKPLPAALVKARMKENEVRGSR